MRDLRTGWVGRILARSSDEGRTYEKSPAAARPTTFLQ